MHFKATWSSPGSSNSGAAAFRYSIAHYRLTMLRNGYAARDAPLQESRGVLVHAARIASSMIFREGRSWERQLELAADDRRGGELTGFVNCLVDLRLVGHVTDDRERFHPELS